MVSQINRLIKSYLAYKMAKMIIAEMPKKYNKVKYTGVMKIKFKDIARLGKQLGLTPIQTRWLFNDYVIKYLSNEGWELIKYSKNRGRANYIFKHRNWGESFLNPQGE